MSSEHHNTKPGYDTTPPASRRMLEVAVLVTVILIILVPFFRSYFKFMTESEMFSGEKIGAEGVKMRAEVEAEQKARLESAPIAIGEAAKQLAAGRASAVAPKASEELGALAGWALINDEKAVEAAQNALEGAARGEDAEGEASEAQGEESEASEEAASAE